MEKEQVGIVAAVAAVAVSPRVRGIVRQGAVYGVAGVLKAGDVVASAAKGAARGAQAGVSGSNGQVRSTPRPASKPASRSAPSSRSKRPAAARTPSPPSSASAT
jgi:hypothetical protein